MKNKLMSTGDQRIQADQYAFPYHYVPQIDRELLLSRHWAFAPSYVAALNLVSESLQSIAESDQAGWRHIDIGCGDGALVHKLARRIKDVQARQIDGVDIDSRAIEWARMFNPGSTFYAGDIASVKSGYASGSLVEVLEHVPPEWLPEFVSSAARVLRPGGFMVVTVPSVEKPIVSKHFQHFSFDSIRAVLSQDFSDINIFGFERYDRTTRFINRLRKNRFFCLDAPALNLRAVANLQQTYSHQSGCGRLFVTCLRKNN